jgi:hypothetical protein
MSMPLLADDRSGAIQHPTEAKAESPTPPDRGGESGSRGVRIIHRPWWRLQLPKIHPRVTARSYPQRPMVALPVEDPTPRQTPTMTELEESQAYSELAEQRTLEWLMSPEDGADIGTMLEQLLHRPSWHALANCRGVGVDRFVIGRGGQYDAVRELCSGCPVREPCLAEAMANIELDGLWGGTSPAERKAMRRGAGGLKARP